MPSSASPRPARRSRSRTRPRMRRPRSSGLSATARRRRPARPLQHTFAAAATYRTYTPNNVDLKVGQPYVITWSTPASEGRTHGLGGLAVLGIAQADNITSNHPYVVNFTPTAGMVGVWTYACTVTQCAPTQSVHDGMTGTLTISP